MSLELIRIILLLVMLGIAAIFDIKTRRVPDHIWIISGGFGAFLYLFDWQNTTSYDILAMITTGAIAILLWFYRVMGQADIFAMASMAAILPVYYDDLVMIPIMITLGAVMIAGIFTILYNAILNLQDWLKLKQRPFSDFDEPIYKKILAFFTVHRKRKDEKFVVLAEKKNDDNSSYKKNVRKLELSGWKKKHDLTKNNMTDILGAYVEKPPPLIVYMFGITVFFLLPELLYVLLV